MQGTLEALTMPVSGDSPMYLRLWNRYIEEIQMIHIILVILYEKFITDSFKIYYIL